MQQGIPLRDYMAVLYKTLEILRGYAPGSSPLYGFSGAPGLIVRSVLIIRICRLIVLVANSASVPAFAKEDTRRAIARSLTGPGDIHTALCTKFLRADSWHDLWNAVRYSQLNRAADELVHLSRRLSNYRPPNIAAVKSIVHSNLNPELEQLLSLVEPDVTLDPKAKPFIPQAENYDTPADAEEDSIEPTQTTADGEANADEFPDMIASEANLLAAPQAEPQRPLTASDIKSGKELLFFYRRYTLRQRVRTRKAVKTIWAYYLRHRLRHNAPMTATEEQIRKLHTEYKKDVESIDYPLLYVKAFQNHERILLGCMPHVLVYLRGLEHVNQQRKEANKERLKKVQHEELDKVRIRMDACVALAKKLKQLAWRIVPGSHSLRQIDTLRDEVKKVDSLRTEIMDTFGEDAIPKPLEEHYALGISTILTPTPAATTAKPPKPDLNVSDLGI
ncbi:unnamed protein product [Rhizoctonia solani]|uniref:Uncharacterized protein n=1 Tax=Rhizoctonia solani TaxID=456999 RepID=A0A8H3GU10_9AGAM|nr:unnamed protein product [Rhizoctonia solani]